MLRETWKRIRRYAIIFAVVLAAVFLAIALARWTGAIEKESERTKLKKALSDLVETEGEKALFSLADIPVREILYGNEGLTVLAGDDSSWDYSFSEMQDIRSYEKVSPSVVGISTSTSMENMGGSGFIISADGYILTNAHVVENAKTILVLLNEGVQSEGKLIGLDSEDDLAIIKVAVDKKNPLVPVTLGESSLLVVGQKVSAVGNPYGYQKALTSGVVSGLGRLVLTDGGKVITNAIQTDAAVNPGNSGGPLINGKGEVVGICSSIFSSTNGSQGVNFAIPIDTVVSLVPDLLKGNVKRATLGIVPVQLTQNLAGYAKLSILKGVLVSQVEAGGAAEKAGLLGGSETVKYGSSIIKVGGDVITEIDGKSIEGLNDYYLALLSHRQGDKVKVTVNRKGEVKVFTVTLGGRTATSN